MTSLFGMPALVLKTSQIPIQTRYNKSKVKGRIKNLDTNAMPVLYKNRMRRQE